MIQKIDSDAAKQAMLKLIDCHLELLMRAVDGRTNGVGISPLELAAVHDATQSIRSLVTQADIVLVDSRKLYETEKNGIQR